MITILDPKNDYLTFINTFAVEPENAENLLTALQTATAEIFVSQTGFVSANLHVSADRRRIVNYAQWRSKADYEAMSVNPEIQRHMRGAAALAISYDPVDYELRHVIAAG